jgi:hypothetical protein
MAIEERSEAYYKSLAQIIEGVRDPHTSIENVDLILNIVGSAADANSSLSSAERHLAIMARINRMRPYLTEDTYQFLLKRFHYPDSSE